MQNKVQNGKKFLTEKSNGVCLSMCVICWTDMVLHYSEGCPGNAFNLEGRDFGRELFHAPPPKRLKPALSSYL